MKRIIAVFLFLFMAAQPALAEEKSSVLMGDTTRDFYVHVPPQAAAGKMLPVVIALHGGGGNALQFAQQTGLDAVADKYGFLAVYPEGTGAFIRQSIRTWNAGRCCGGAARGKIDDVGFISAVIDKLVAEYNADPKRVYATGHSNGAMMSYRLACQLSSKIAAIAPNSGQRVFDDCHPARHVPVLHLHGTADPCALYNGGDKCGGCFGRALGMSALMPGDTWSCRPVPDVVRDHASLNGCGDKTTIVFQKGAVTCRRYDCPADGATELCTIEGAGHAWPGLSDNGPALCAKKPDAGICAKYHATTGGRNTDIDGGDFVWNFFKDQHLP